jgi:hypothetical protein
VVATPEHRSDLTIGNRPHDRRDDLDRRTGLEVAVAHVFGPQQRPAGSNPASRSLSHPGPYIADFSAHENRRARRIVVARLVVRDDAGEHRLQPLFGGDTSAHHSTPSSDRRYG